MQETNTSLQPKNRNQGISKDVAKKQLTRLSNQIDKLVEEVKQLREEKKALQGEISRLSEQVAIASKELVQTESLVKKVIDFCESSHLLDEFPPVIFTHEEKLLIRQRITQVLERIDIELQRL
ncbi:hypothetical protein [Chloroherpeton thalassium]|nr:hypothetical protein [Chloroherpeton thalassium]